MVLVLVHDGEFKIAVERRARYGLPHKNFIVPRTAQQFDLNHRNKGKKYICRNLEVSEIAQTLLSDGHSL